VDQTERTAAVPRLSAVRAADVIAIPRPEEVIEGIATVGGVTVLPSESGTGKTFLLLDMAAAVSGDIKWHGRETIQGSVAYISFEGDALGLRLRALRDIHGHRLEHVYVIRATDPISPRVTRDGEERSAGEMDVIVALETLSRDLAAAGLPPIRVSVIDTVRASMTGSEDSSEHVSAYLRAARRILAATPHAGLILAHHAGWQDGETQKKRERGSSAWRGNVDCTLYLERGEYDAVRGEGELTLRVLKARDGEPLPPLHLIRRRVELDEVDRYGRPVTTCVIDRDRRTREDREAAEQQAADTEQQAVDRRVLQLMLDNPETVKSQDRIRIALQLRREVAYAAIDRVVARGWADPPARQRQPYTVTSIGRAVLAGGA
jgi:hypothetical protein